MLTGTHSLPPSQPNVQHSGNNTAAQHPGNHGNHGHYSANNPTHHSVGNPTQQIPTTNWKPSFRPVQQPAPVYHNGYNPAFYGNQQPSPLIKNSNYQSGSRDPAFVSNLPDHAFRTPPNRQQVYQQDNRPPERMTDWPSVPLLYQPGMYNPYHQPPTQLQYNPQHYFEPPQKDPRQDPRQDPPRGELGNNRTDVVHPHVQYNPQHYFESPRQDPPRAELGNTRTATDVVHPVERMKQAASQQQHNPRFERSSQSEPRTIYTQSTDGSSCRNSALSGRGTAVFIPSTTELPGPLLVPQTQQTISPRMADLTITSPKGPVTGMTTTSEQITSERTDETSEYAGRHQQDHSVNSDLSDLERDDSDGSYTIIPPDSGHHSILPEQRYQVKIGLSKVVVKGADIERHGCHSNPFFIVRSGRDCAVVHGCDIRAVKRRSEILKGSSKPPDTGRSQHVFLRNGTDKGSWVEVPASHIAPGVDSSTSEVQLGDKRYTVAVGDVSEIEERVEEVPTVSVYLNGEWTALTRDRVKESIRKPGTYVIITDTRNIRVPASHVSFTDEQQQEGKEEDEDEYDQTVTEDKSFRSEVSTKLDISEYNVFIDGRFIRLSGRYVCPITSKPGFYRVLNGRTKHVIHTNLVLPIVSLPESGEVVVAPTHFRCLLETGEFIVPAESVRPDPRAYNGFLVQTEADTLPLRVKSSLLLPLWMNSETLCGIVETPQTTPRAARRKGLVRSRSADYGQEYVYKVLRGGRTYTLKPCQVDTEEVYEGYYKIQLDGSSSWVYHPAYCITRVRKLPERRFEQAEKSWQDSLRGAGGGGGCETRPRWKYCPLTTIRQRGGRRSGEHHQGDTTAAAPVTPATPAGLTSGKLSSLSSGSGGTTRAGSSATGLTVNGSGPLG
eukprot:sb/3461902/